MTLVQQQNLNTGKKEWLSSMCMLAVKTNLLNYRITVLWSGFE